mmetsp:Transcript_12759/g.31864  ORF Transcript_12759/g.31864 Transcript_12759/m.31864 type:complete len:452 (+) Transcript_12759:151-1506(+)
MEYRRKSGFDSIAALLVLCSSLAVCAGCGDPQPDCSEAWQHCSDCGSSLATCYTSNDYGSYGCADGVSGQIEPTQTVDPPPSPASQAPPSVGQPPVSTSPQASPPPSFRTCDDLKAPSRGIISSGNNDQCSPYRDACRNACGGGLSSSSVPMEVNVVDGSGTYRCSCCDTASVTPETEAENASITLNFSHFPVWIWVIILATPFAVWGMGFCLLYLGKRSSRAAQKSQSTRPDKGKETSPEALPTDDFELPFGASFPRRLEAVFWTGKGRASEEIFCSDFIPSFLQYRTNFLRVHKDEQGTATWQEITIGEYCHEHSSLMRTIRTWKTKDEINGMCNKAWRCKSIFNGMFALALSIAFGTVALDAEVVDQSSCRSKQLHHPQQLLHVYHCKWGRHQPARKFFQLHYYCGPANCRSQLADKIRGQIPAARKQKTPESCYHRRLIRWHCCARG